MKRDSNAVLFRLCAKLHTERANGSQSWVTDLPTDIITESQLRPSYPLICPLMKSQITLLLSFFLEYSFWPLMPTTHIHPEKWIRNEICRENKMWIMENSSIETHRSQLLFYARHTVLCIRYRPKGQRQSQQPCSNRLTALKNKEQIVSWRI